MEGVEEFITFASNKNSSIRGNPCYVLVEDVKTKRNVMQEHLWDSSTDSASRIIIILSSCGENYYDVGESSVPALGVGKWGTRPGPTFKTNKFNDKKGPNFCCIFAIRAQNIIYNQLYCI